MKRTSASRDVEEMAKWCSIVVRRIEQQPAAGTVNSLLPIIEATRVRGGRAGMKMLVRHVEEWVGGLPDALRRQIDSDLRAELGVGLLRSARERLAEVKGVVARGAIQTDEEYRLLESRADELAGKRRSSRELDAVNRLLADYVRHVGRRMQSGDGEK